MTRDEVVAAVAAKDARYAQHVRKSAGLVARVRRRGCCKSQVWAWVVTLDGVVKDSGECKSELEALRESNESAAELRELL